MKVYNNIKTIVENGSITLEFAPPCCEMPVFEALKQCKERFLLDRIEELYRARSMSGRKEIELADNVSRLRGYAGGLLHVQGNGEKIVCVRRNGNAQRIPDRLDISADTSSYGVREDDWLELILVSGFEQILYAKEDGCLYIPQLGCYCKEEDTHTLGCYCNGYNSLIKEKIIENVLQTPLSIKGHSLYPVRLRAPKNAAKVRLHSSDKPFILEFASGFAFEPENSGLDLMMYAVYPKFPESAIHQDTCCTLDGCYSEKKTFEIDVPTGKVSIWQHGKIVRESSLEKEVEGIIKVTDYAATNKLKELISPDAWPFDTDPKKLEVLIR